MKKYKTIYLVYNKDLPTEHSRVYPMVYEDLYEAGRAKTEGYSMVEVGIPVNFPEVDEILEAKDVQ